MTIGEFHNWVLPLLVSIIGFLLIAVTGLGFKYILTIIGRIEKSIERIEANLNALGNRVEKNYVPRNECEAHRHSYGK